MDRCVDNCVSHCCAVEALRQTSPPFEECGQDVARAGKPARRFPMAFPPVAWRVNGRLCVCSYASTAASLRGVSGPVTALGGVVAPAAPSGGWLCRQRWSAISAAADNLGDHRCTAHRGYAEGSQQYSEMLRHRALSCSQDKQRARRLVAVRRPTAWCRASVACCSRSVRRAAVGLAGCAYWRDYRVNGCLDRDASCDYRCRAHPVERQYAEPWG